MAIKLKHLFLVLGFFTFLSVIFGIVAAAKTPSYGTPVRSKDGVTCQISYDAAIIWCYISVAFLVASNVVGSFSFFLPDRKFVSPKLYCFPIVAVIMSGVAATSLLSPKFYNHLSQHKVHYDLNYDCPIIDFPGYGAALSVAPAFLWCVFASEFGREDFPEDNDVNGDQHVQSHYNFFAALHASVLDFYTDDFDSASAPPIADEIPSVAVDLGHVVDISSPAIGKLQEEGGGGGGGENVAGGGSGCSTCVICLVAPTEGAFVPCGHVAGCMSCLNKVEITKNKWGCPVCRANIDGVMKLYYV